MKQLSDDRFVFTVDRHGCVDRIAPTIRTAGARLDTIGAIFDVTARHKGVLKEFFDPKVRGDCVVHDHHSHRAASLRHGQTLPCCATRQAWRRVAGHWEWTLTIAHAKGRARELSVELRLPLPIYPGSVASGHSRWALWAPIAGAPFEGEYGLRIFHHCKCVDEDTDLPMPLFVLYRRTGDFDLGLSYLLPPDQMRYVDFLFNQRDWLMTATFRNLALTEGGAIRLRLLCFSHAGDWRPALGWARKQYPALLGAVKGQEKIDGNMAYTVPIPERQVRNWVRTMGLKWNELVLYRDFGNFTQDEPFDASHFRTPEHPEWSADGLTWDAVNRYVDMCHEQGVSVMPYFNLWECESGLARRFSDSIVRILDGNELTTWRYYDKTKHCIQMNADPQYSWFQFVFPQYIELYRRVPQIDGFFFDQSGMGWIDTAHFDGETFYAGKPAYNLGNMYVRAYREVRKAFPRPRFICQANGPCRWQLMEFFDGSMAEGVPSFLGRDALLCPERPVMCLAEGEYAFQMALLYGAWLHVSPYYRYAMKTPLPKDAVRLFAAYNPLFEFLKGRKWVYAPAPLQVTVTPRNEYTAPLIYPGLESLRANLFETPSGDYVATVLAAPRGIMSRERFLRGVTVRVKTPGIRAYSTAVVFGPDYKGYYVREPRMSGDGYAEIRIPRHGAATMVVLTKDFSRLQNAYDWTKLREKELR
jgi:hypothetical protein